MNKKFSPYFTRIGTLAEDGTRYGARPNEQWCTEFFAWSAKNKLERIADEDSVSDMIKYFKSYNAFYEGKDLAEKARRGDYVALDTDDDGKKNPRLSGCHTRVIFSHFFSTRAAVSLLVGWTNVESSKS
jgi:hypothetical protein